MKLYLLKILDLFKKWTVWSVIIWLILIIILTILYWKWNINLPIILTSKEYISLLFWILGFSLWMYKFFYVIELKNIHKNHFDYISHIIEQNNISINRTIFTSFEEAKEEYEKYKKWYILPYWYKYSILNWSIDDYNFSDIFNIDEFENFVIYNDNKIYREFVDLEDFKKNILWEEKDKRIEITTNWYNQTLKEYFILDSSTIFDIKKWLKENSNIVILKWYLFINFLKNA